MSIFNEVSGSKVLGSGFMGSEFWQPQRAA